MLEFWLITTAVEKAAIIGIEAGIALMAYLGIKGNSKYNKAVEHIEVLEAEIDRLRSK